MLTQPPRAHTRGAFLPFSFGASDFEDLLKGLQHRRSWWRSRRGTFTREAQTRTPLPPTGPDHGKGQNAHPDFSIPFPCFWMNSSRFLRISSSLESSTPFSAPTDFSAEAVLLVAKGTSEPVRRKRARFQQNRQWGKYLPKSLKRTLRKHLGAHEDWGG